MRRFAEDTSVSVGRSRGEIDDLLRNWGCSGIAWLDEFEEGRVELQFKWKRDGDQLYIARFTVMLLDDKAIREQAKDGRSHSFSETKYRKMCEARGRWEHRVLLLWLKAALSAVEAGIVDPALIFLPFLVGKNGRTVGEVALPRLSQLLTSNADRLLTGGTD